MKRYGILWLALSSATVLALTACGGGGGGAAGGGNPAFTNFVVLEGPGGALVTTASAATSINTPTGVNRLEVVGMADDATNPGVLQPVVWDFASNAIAVEQTPGSVGPPVVPATPANGIPAADLIAEDLPGLVVASEFGAAFGNNDAGEIVGQSEVAVGGTVEAAFWTNDDPLLGRTVFALDAGIASAAYDINNNGLIVGERTPAAVALPVVYDRDAEPVVPVELPLPVGATSGSAYSINDANVIVGELTDATGTHAAVWKPITTTALVRTDYEAPIILAVEVGTVADPATLVGDAVALAIGTGANGVVVGEIIDTATGMVHAVRWPSAAATAVVQDLGANASAAGINSGGRVVGSADNAASAWGAGVVSVEMHALLIDGQGNAINTGSKAAGAAGGLAFFATP